MLPIRLNIEIEDVNYKPDITVNITCFLCVKFGFVIFINNSLYTQVSNSQLTFIKTSTLFLFTSQGGRSYFFEATFQVFLSVAILLRRKIRNQEKDEIYQGRFDTLKLYAYSCRDIYCQHITRVFQILLGFSWSTGFQVLLKAEE